MINLFEMYNEESRLLHESLKLAGYDNKTIAVDTDGFFPEDINSPYFNFLGNENLKDIPKYFNGITVPRFWEISANNSMGEVYEFNEKRANIFYTEPAHKRLVRTVEWLDDKENVVRIIDYYNKYGRRYAQTVFNLKQEPIVTSYFDTDNKEIIVENHVTLDIILNEDNKVKFFHNKEEFVTYYLEKLKSKNETMIYNRLSLPFFVSNKMTSEKETDILFWQEEIYDEIPGNMLNILNSNSTKTKKVIVTDKVVYNKLLDLLTEEQKKKVDYLGYIYPFIRKNKGRATALILTNSDEIEQLEKIVTSLPNVEFKIGAITEMSPKLMNFGNYDNVKLYPNIKMDKVDELREECDIYLDINHHNEILSGVEWAFLNNMLIFSFENTIHKRMYTAEENIFEPSDVDIMIGEIRNIVKDKNYLGKLLLAQHKKAGAETKERYQAVLGR